MGVFAGNGATLRLANAPVSWGIMEVEGWSPPIAFTQVMDAIAQCGYEATELGPFGYYPTDAAQLRDELARRNLALTSAFVPLRLKDRAAVAGEVAQAVTVGKLLAACGAKYLVLSDHLWPERMACAGWAREAGVTLSAGDWSVVGASIRRVAGAARELGLRCVFHHHAGTYVETPAEIETLLNEVAAEELGLCLDTGHYYYGGGDPVDAVRRYRSRVEYLHFKDVSPAALDEVRREGLGFLDGVRRGVFCQLGRGGVNFPALKRELEELHYRGWAVVEQDTDATAPGAAAQATASARASREFLLGLGF
jgi:inosose dehydratase